MGQPTSWFRALVRAALPGGLAPSVAQHSRGQGARRRASCDCHAVQRCWQGWEASGSLRAERGLCWGVLSGQGIRVLAGLAARTEAASRKWWEGSPSPSVLEAGGSQVSDPCALVLESQQGTGVGEELPGSLPLCREGQGPSVCPRSVQGGGHKGGQVGWAWLTRLPSSPCFVGRNCSCRMLLS